ncbi:LysR substrate-binding domain-containing protein [Paraburkholderia sacchari]|uniref:LysR substrate-binding domain-containing protein n=1 Tax=Paraburkholderia sacchari TaxID=159450 RepID=UPI003144F423
MSSLLAFEASAQTESFTRAAQQLSLTQSAVSRQVQTLEEQLGVPLFQRHGRRVVLTDVGRMYLREISGPLERIRSASLQAISFQAGGGTLHLSVLPTFGSRWLMPRLPDFYSAHSEVVVHVHTRTYLDLDVSGMDAAIVVGDGHWLGAVTYPLLAEEIVPVISRDDAGKISIRTIDQLLQYSLLRVVSRPTAWRDWFANHGYTGGGLKLGPQFEMTEHLIQAVSAGLGIGLVPKFLVEKELEAGTLVIAFNEARTLSEKGYYLVVPSGRESYPPFVLFRDWLIGLTRGAPGNERP